jgi:hypothetical protein
MKQNDNMARICAGECPFGYDCKAMDCEECAKIHADKEA